MSENGSKWARAGLVAGIIASVAGNVANAFLTHSQASTALRVPLAVVWPVFLFIGVEVLVRNRAARGPLARIGQAALLTTTVPTAITSFVNLHALMIKAGEPGMAQLSGPLAIDGLMLGCTIMLLATRVHVDTVTVHMDNRTATFTPADEDTDAEWMADVEAGHKATSAGQGLVLGNMFQAWESELDTMDLDPVATQPVSGAGRGSNEIKPESVPAEARATLLAWLDTAPADRPSPGRRNELIAATHGVSTRTARRWFDAMKPRTEV
jgi:hypothetical protein